MAVGDSVFLVWWFGERQWLKKIIIKYFIWKRLKSVFS